MISREEGWTPTLTREQILPEMEFSRLQPMMTQVQTGIAQGSLYTSKNLLCQFVKNQGELYICLTLNNPMPWSQTSPLLHNPVTRRANNAFFLTDAVPFPDDEPSPDYVLRPCALLGLCAETTSLPLPAAESLPNDSLVAGSSHTPHNSSIVAPSIYEAKAPTTYSAPMASLPPASAFPPSLPPASAFRHQPISPPGKANIVAILRRRELDSKK